MLENSIIYQQHTMKVQLLNCNFHDNIAQKGGAIFCYTLDFPAATIKNSLNAQIVNCTFNSNNATKGSTIYSNNFMASAELFVRNSISWGNNAVAQGSAIYLTGVNPSLHKTDIENSLFDAPNCNANSSFFAGGASSINCLGGNLFNQNPQFVNPAAGNFRLAAGSPAINAGNNAFLLPSMSTDIIGNIRIDNGTVDMGCYENFPGMLKQAEDQPVAEAMPGLEREPSFRLSPNPARDQVKVNILSGSSQGGAIFDLMGKMVQQWDGEVDALDLSNMPAGVYLVRVQFEGSSQTQRLVKE
jgi:hypothetical protein